MQEIRRAPESGGWRDVDDFAASLGFHLREYRLGAKKRAFDIDRGDAVPLFSRNFIKRMALDIDKYRRVVDQDIDAPKGVHRLRGHAVGVLFLGNIDRQSSSSSSG